MKVKLQTEVEMREKMRAHLGNKHRDRFDIKADEGELPIIEFITQYLVLRRAHETEVNALVRQRAYSELRRKDIMKSRKRR